MIERLLPFRLTSSIGRLFSGRGWLLLLLVPGLMVLSFALGITADRTQMTIILALLAGSAGVLLFLRWPPLGLVIALVIGMVAPTIGPAGLNVSIVLIGLLLGLWLLTMVMAQRHFSLVPSPTMRPALIWLIVVCLAFVAGQLPWFTFTQNAPLDAQLGGLGLFLFSIGAFLLSANQVRHIRWLKAMTWVFLGVGAYYITGRMFPAFGQTALQIFQRQSIGGMFWAWLPAMAFAQAMFNRELNRIWRLALLTLALGTIYVAYVQVHDWKSGWVVASAAIFSVIGFRSWRAGLALAVVALPFAAGVAQEMLSAEEYSVSTRLEAWLILLEILKISPIIGFGFANYYWFTPLFPIRGYYLQFNSHNNFVDVVAQTGLVGLICFLWFFWAVGRLGWRLRTRVPAGFPRAYVYGALGGLGGMLVAAMLGDWVLPFVYNVGLNGFKTGVVGWLFLGGLVALEQIYAGPTPATKEGS